MSRPLDLGLRQTRNLLIRMGRLAEEAIKRSLKGFQEMEDVYEDVRDWSNTLLILSSEVEEQVTSLIALHQPMARDLRTLRAYLKIAYDLERFGRYALDIADLLRGIGPWRRLEEIPLGEMGEKVMDMVKAALSLVEDGDRVEMIDAISMIEKEVDSLYRRGLKTLAGVEADARTIIAHILTIRYLERIADHAIYITESMTYALTGRRFSLR